MKRGVIYALLAAAAVIMVLKVSDVGVLPRAAAGATTRAEPEASRIAVCDVYGAAEKVLDTERFKPARVAEQERITAEIKPIADALKEMQGEIEARGIDPKSPEGQEKAKAYQHKAEEFGIASQKGQQQFRQFVSRQFLEALQLVKASCEKVAEEKGFTYVIASRDVSKPIETLDPERLIEAFLGRPVVVRPSDADITADVLDDLDVSVE
jgi:Skp family chaperone for outer membrane proteins